MAEKAQVSSLFDDKNIKSALKKKGLDPSTFPTLSEIGVRVPEVIPKDEALKTALKSKLVNEANDKITSYSKTLDDARASFVDHFLHRSFGQDTKESTLKEMQKCILKGTIDQDNLKGSFTNLISKTKFDQTFGNQSEMLTDLYYKSTHLLAPLMVGAIRTEISDKLGIKAKPTSEQKESLARAKENIIQGINNAKVPSQNEAAQYVSNMAWKSVEQEFRTYAMAASAGLADMKRKDPQGYEKLEQEAKGGSTPEVDVHQTVNSMFAPSFAQHKADASRKPSAEGADPAPAPDIQKPKPSL